MKLKDIAERLGGRLEGDGEIEVRGVAGLEEAGPADLTFYSNPRYTTALRRTRAGGVILGEGGEVAPCAMLRVVEPYVAFATAVGFFADSWRPDAGVHPSAFVAEGATIGQGASVGPFAVIGERARIGARTIVHAHVTVGRECHVGEDCVVHARVSLRERVTIGDRVIIQDGAVVGSDGFGFARRADGTHQKIPQIGGVVIEDDVEIGANTTIDRPAVGETRIGAGTKIDNLVQIAHGVQIGRHVLLAGQVGIAGSSTIEDGVTLAGQVGVAGHLTIGKGAIATAQSGIPNSVEPGAFVSGYPAIPNRDWLKSSAIYRKLPELRRQISDLERRLAELATRVER